MSCPDEIALTCYLDGELTGEALTTVERHLAGCTTCRDLLAALRQESATLVQALQECAAPAPALQASAPATNVIPLSRPVRTPSAAGGDVRSLGWGLAAAAAIALAIGGNALERALSGRLDLAQSVATTVALRSLIDGVFSVAQGGTTMLSSVQFAVFAIVGGLLLIAALRAVWQRRLLGSSLLVALGSALLLLPTAARAIEIRQGDTVGVAADEIVTGPVVLTGGDITVAGTVDTDVIAIGRNIVVSGTVRGNLFAAAKSVDVTGRVEGSQHLAAQSLSVGGDVGGNSYLAGQDLVLRDRFQAHRDTVVAGETITVDGAVGNDLTVFGNQAKVNGQVGRDIDFHGDTLRVNPSARVGRDIKAEVSAADKFRVDDKAAVAGTRDFKVRIDDMDPDDDRPFVTAGFYTGFLLRLIAALVVALLLFVLAPALVAARPVSGQPVLKQMGIGFLWLVATPIACLIAGITIIGLPLALTGGVAYAVALYLAGIEVALAIGQLLVRDARRSFGPWALAAALGLLIVLVARELPIVGGVVSLLVLCWGLGLLYGQLSALYRAARAPVQPVTPA